MPALLSKRRHPLKLNYRTDSSVGACSRLLTRLMELDVPRWEQSAGDVTIGELNVEGIHTSGFAIVGNLYGVGSRSAVDFSGPRDPA